MQAPWRESTVAAMFWGAMLVTSMAGMSAFAQGFTAAQLAEQADALESRGDFAKAGLNYFEILDRFPGTQYSRDAYSRLADLSALFIAGRVPDSEVNSFELSLPHWSDAKSAESRYVLLGFSYSKAAALRQAGMYAAASAAYEDTAALSLQFIESYPNHPLQLFAHRHLYEAAYKLGSENLENLDAQLKSWIAADRSTRSHVARIFHALYLERIEGNLSESLIELASFVDESRTGWLQQIVEDPTLYDSLKSWYLFYAGHANAFIGDMRRSQGYFQEISLSNSAEFALQDLAAYYEAFVEEALSLSNPSERMDAYERYVERFPGGKYAPLALRRVADVHVQEDDLQSAAAVYRRILNEYPNSSIAISAVNSLVELASAIGEDPEDSLDSSIAALAESCGPVALHYLLASRGIPSTTRELAIASGSTSEGTSLDGMIRAARDKGARLWAIEHADLNQLSVPFIALIDDDHLVLVESVDEQRIVCRSLHQQPVPVRRDLFERHWDGVGLIFESSTVVASRIPNERLTSIVGGAGEVEGDSLPSDLGGNCANAEPPPECEEDAAGHGGAGMSRFELATGGTGKNGVVPYFQAYGAGSPVQNMGLPGQDYRTGIRSDNVRLKLDAFQGALQITAPDITVDTVGGMAIRFTRTYHNGQGHHDHYFQENYNGDGPAFKNNIGRSWTHSFNQHIRVSSQGGYLCIFNERGFGQIYSKVGEVPEWNIAIFEQGAVSEEDDQGTTEGEANLVIQDLSTGRYSLQLPHGLSYHFSAEENSYARLESVTDTSGNEIVLTYNGSSIETGKLVRIDTPAGDPRYVEIFYRPFGLMDRVELKSGSIIHQKVTYDYSNGYLTSVQINDQPNLVQYAYGQYSHPNAGGTGEYISQIVDRDGKVYDIAYTYELKDLGQGFYGLHARTIQVNYPDGSHTHLNRPQGQLSSSLTNHSQGQELNRQTVYPGPKLRRARNREIVNPSGQNERWTYTLDLERDLTRVVVPSMRFQPTPNYFEYVYTGNGRIQSVTAPDGNQWLWEYNTGAFQQTLYPIRQTDPIRGVTDFVYDANSRIQTILAPFEDDFDDGDLAGWSVSGSWDVSTGAARSGGDPAAESIFRTVTDDDYVLRLSYTLNNSPLQSIYYGAVRMRYNPTTGDRIEVRFHSNQIAVWHTDGASSSVLLGASTQATSNEGTEYDIRMAMQGTSLRIWRKTGNDPDTLILDLNNAPVIDGTRLMLYARISTDVTFDNILCDADDIRRNTTYSYTANGDVATKSVDGQVWTYGYTPEGFLQSVTEPNASVTSATYDGLGNITSITSPDLELTEYVYSDPYNPRKPTEIQHSDGSGFLYAYSRSGRLVVRVRDDLSEYEEYEYDTQNRLWRIKKQYGGPAMTVLTRDGLGRITTAWVNGIGTTTYVYDHAHRLKDVYYPDGSEEHNTFLDNGRVVQQTDENGTPVGFVKGYAPSARSIDAKYDPSVPTPHMDGENNGDECCEDEPPCDCKLEETGTSQIDPYLEFDAEAESLRESMEEDLEAKGALENVELFIENQVTAEEGKECCPDFEEPTDYTDVDGSYPVTGTAELANEGPFTFDFDQVLEDGTVITGSVTINAEISVNVSGEITVSGKTDAECDECVELDGETTVRATVELPGSSGPGTYTATPSGVPEPVTIQTTAKTINLSFVAEAKTSVGSDCPEETEPQEAPCERVLKAVLWATIETSQGPVQITSHPTEIAPAQNPCSPDDLDGDGEPNDEDNDIDGDGIPNDSDTDDDGDGIPDVLDDCPHSAADTDGDGVEDACDNCPLIRNPEQDDADPWNDDGGDVCDADGDFDDDGDADESDSANGDEITDEENKDFGPEEQDPDSAQPDNRDGDPVLLHSGEFYEQMEDLRVDRGVMDLTWMRTYRSRYASEGSGLGGGWDHSYNIWIAVEQSETGGTGQTVPLKRLVLHDGGSGRTQLWTRDNRTTRVWRNPDTVGYMYTLFGATSMFWAPENELTVKWPDGTRWTFDVADAMGVGAGGELVRAPIKRIDHPEGASVEFSYNGNDQLIQIEHKHGTIVSRSWTVAWNGDQIASVTDAVSSSSVSYTFAGTANQTRLATVTHVDGSTTAYEYELSGPYPLLTTITDGRGNMYLRNSYDPLAAGRVESQEYGGDGSLAPGPGTGYPWYFEYFPDGTVVGGTAGSKARAVITPTRELRLYVFDSESRMIERREYEEAYSHGLPPLTAEVENWVNSTAAATTVYSYETDLDLVDVVTYADGSSVDYDYDLGSIYWFRRGNLRTKTYQPAGGALAQVQSWDYWPFGIQFYYGNYGGSSRTPSVYTDPMGNQTLRSYDTDGRLITIQYMGTGVTESFGYRSGGGEAPLLDTHTVTHLGAGGVTEYMRTVEFEYDNHDYVNKTIVDPNGLELTTNHVNDEFGRPMSVTDPNGNTTTYVYDAKGRITQEISPAITPVTGAAAYTVTTDYTYDGNGNLKTVTVDNLDKDGVPIAANPQLTTIFKYDLLNNRTEVSEEVGYDANGLEVDDVYQVRTMEYTDTGQLEAVIEPHGRSSTMTYDGRGQLKTVTNLDTLGATLSTTTYEYDDMGNRESRTVQAPLIADRVTVWGYDDYNRMSRRTDPLGNRVEFAYDLNNNLERQSIVGDYYGTGDTPVKSLLAETTFTYDAFDRVETETQWIFQPESGVEARANLSGGAAAAVTEYAYLGLDRPRTVTDPEINVWTNAYDDAGRLETVTDPKSNVQRYFYDAAGNVTRQELDAKSDVDASVTTYAVETEYDAFNRPMRVKNVYLDELGQPQEDVTEIAYDGRDNVVYSKDPEGRTVDRAIDGLGRLQSAEHRDAAAALMAGHALSWDPVTGRLISRTDPTGNGTDYGYDDAGRLADKTFADGTQVSYEYNALGELTSAADANGSVTVITPDALGRAVNMAIAPGSGVSTDATFVDFRYDGAGSVVYGANDDSVVRRVFDSRGLARSETLQWTVGTAASVTTPFEYDVRGSLAQVQYPVSGATIAYTQDALGFIDELTELGQGLIASYDYRGPGRVERRTLHGNDTRTDYAFDGRGRTVGTTHLDIPTSAVFDDRAYAWDRVNNKLTRTELDPVTGLPVLTHSYQYDALDRMEQSTRTSAGQSGTSIDYTLDASGNRTLVAGGPAPGAYTPTQPPLSRVHEYASTPVAPYTRTHDENGNFLGGQPGVDETLTYDAFNRLVGYSGAGGSPSAQYTYDAFGRRIQTIVVDASGAVTTRYVYHGDRVIEEVDETATSLIASYVYGNDIDEVLRMRRDVDGIGGAEDYFYHQDDLFNVVALTDENGDVVERYDYGDYGAPEVMDASGAPLTATAYANPYLFQGRRYDTESSLYYFRARYLDPATGRFTSRDPLGIWADLLNLGNGYTFAGNNPWSRRDPFGLESGGNQTMIDEIRGSIDEALNDLRDALNGLVPGLGDYLNGRLRGYMARTDGFFGELTFGAFQPYSGLYDIYGDQSDNANYTIGQLLSLIGALESAGMKLAGKIAKKLDILERLREGLGKLRGLLGLGGKSALDDVVAGVGRGGGLDDVVPPGVADDLGKSGSKSGPTIRNAHLAGKTHPKTGIPFDEQGYPDFSSVSRADVQISQTGNRPVDFRLANQIAGLRETPKGYTWHHHQDGITMQLVPTDIHSMTGHTGGVARQ